MRPPITVAIMVLVVATYEAILNIPQPVDKTFSFVSDFCNAVHWDPRTYAVERTTDGPIGVGTQFMLTGGLMREELVRRLHIPQRIAGMALPYDVVKFDPPNEFVLKGESRIFRYCDDLEFFPESSGTRLRYFAELEMKGPLAIGEPLLQRMFKRIGDDATRNLPATVDHSV